MIVYVLVIVLMMIFENALIFPAPTFPTGNWQHEFEDVYFTSADGTRLHGWYVEHKHPRAHVLFSHGNGEHVAYLYDMLTDYRAEFQVSIFAYDYRGYGRSQGTPHEKGILADGHAAQLWLAQRAGIKPNEIILVGRSLGGAVAVDQAANNGARALVLERTFTKMPDVAARLYPILPVRLLMKTQLDSLSKINRYDGPLLQSHGTADDIIPFDLGQKLFAAATTSEKYFFVEQGLGHNDAYSSGYWKRLREFLQSVSQ